MSPKKNKRTMGKRGFKILAHQAIGNDIFKGLIELITNADDSYTRLEKSGSTVNGKIIVKIDRHPRKSETLLQITDFAEGMDNDTFDKCVGEYGEDSSRDSGRGIFGMGLNDTINGFGHGRIISFKDGRFYECILKDYDDFDNKPGRKITQKDRNEWGITGNGTVIDVVITNPKIKISGFDKIKSNLSKHVCLRKIMSDPKRNVRLQDFDNTFDEDCILDSPLGDKLFENDLEIDLPGYPNVRAHLIVFKVYGETGLTQIGSYRTGGILITSKRTVHQSTLFGFDNDPDASKLFGELRCDEIYDLQKSGEEIVDRNRNGLIATHPLTEALFQAATKVIGEIVEKEKEAVRNREKQIENEKTRKRFQTVVKELNEIATKELEGFGGPGKGPGTKIKPPKPLPQDGFEYIPDEYRVLISCRKSLSLNVMLSDTIKPGDLIETSSNIEGIRVLTPTSIVPEIENKEMPAVISIIVEGNQPNAEAMIISKCNGKEACAIVTVVSEKKDVEPPKRKGGLFKDIKYEEAKHPLTTRYDAFTGIIWINTNALSISLYFDKDGIGQDEPQNQVLVAELVTDVACYEICKQKKKGKWIFPLVLIG